MYSLPQSFLMGVGFGATNGAIAGTVLTVENVGNGGIAMLIDLATRLVMLVV